MFASFNPRALDIRANTAESLALATHARFPGVDLLVLDALNQNLDLRQLRSQINDLGLKPGAFPFPFNWRNSSPEQFTQDLEQLKRCADAAALLGSTRTGTWIHPSVPDQSTNHPHPHLANPTLAHFIRDRLRQIAAILADRHIIIGIEVLGIAHATRKPNEVPFVDRLADLEPRLGPLNDIGPNVGIVVDSFHLEAAGEVPANALANAQTHVAWVHIADLPAHSADDPSQLNDQVRALPGESGRTTVADLLRLLANRRYDGPITPEPFGQSPRLVGQPPLEIARRAAHSVRDAWPAGVPGAPALD
jgi:sugar phosphate isomerase/epimerase